MRAAPFLALLFAASAFAQAERVPKVIKEAERDNDNIVARRAFDAAARALLTPAYREAVSRYAPSANDLLATWGTFEGGAQQWPFYALQLAPRDASALKAGERVTFFGQLDDENGKSVATYNERQAVIASNGDLFVERSLVMPLKKSRGTFGLARGNDIIGMARVEFEPDDQAKTSGMSALIVSSDVHIMPAAQSPTEPFAFGGTKVEPKPGATFRKSNELWVFTVFRGPALGTDGLPRLTMKTEMIGSSRSFPGMTVSAEVTHLSGAQYGLGSTIDMSSLPPDDYKVRLTVIDTIAKQTFVREAAVHIRP
jgi:hypothetical protein